MSVIYRFCLLCLRADDLLSASFPLCERVQTADHSLFSFCHTLKFYEVIYYHCRNIVCFAGFQGTENRKIVKIGDIILKLWCVVEDDEYCIIFHEKTMKNIQMLPGKTAAERNWRYVE